MNVWKQLHLQLQLQLHLHHVKTNGKPKNVTRGKIRGTVPRKRSRKTARKLVKFANHDVLSYSENTFRHKTIFLAGFIYGLQLDELNNNTSSNSFISNRMS